VPAGWHITRREEAPAQSGAAERQSAGRKVGLNIWEQLFPNSLYSLGTVNYCISGYLFRASGG